ncbi:efflux RND transporter periplasmic adaptor subunit [Synoicihabitans lomoniglobus]|uniref:Efflux RND transporter periplasmic adaptor subunit n=1 Tax=Synoicihabitans lomoniglobus TaxID=2909285 RepID=A0AAE9ZYN1_9BACT|nr:efflux RND transporter periplasmic adaptor subunit [Opitutaceae bacterium LMO-M01]WED65018.1 efflux RND transporter periplasmic adaptor subunit [Opitutaceae bacterium LMO-M01]
MASSASSPSSSAPAAKKKKKSKTLWWVLGGVVLVLLLAVPIAMKNRGADKGTKVFVAEAALNDVTQFVTATGKIEPEVEVKIAPEVSGEIVELPIAEGDKVNKGALLMRIKDDNYRYQVDQREADLAASRAAAVQSKAQLFKTEADFKRTEDIYAKKLVSEADFLSGKTSVEVAQANYTSAQAQVRRAEGLLAQAKDQLDKTIIYAPMDGTISRLPVEIGERVTGTGGYNASEVMRVADLTNMEVVVQVNENDVVNVKVGNKARIDIDAFPKREFTGKVTEIASTAITTGQNTQSEVTNFEVRIRVDTDGETIKPGMSALADIETATVTQVVTVPIQSVTVRSHEDDKTIDELAEQREADKKANKGEGAATAENLTEQRERERKDKEDLRRVVFVVEGGKVKLIDVETGIADTTNIEIKSGIEAGQQVVSGSYATITRVLKDDMDVTIQKPRGQNEKKDDE